MPTAPIKIEQRPGARKEYFRAKVAADKYIFKNSNSPLYAMGTIIAGFGWYTLQDLKSDIKSDISNLKEETNRNIQNIRNDMAQDRTAAQLDHQNFFFFVLKKSDVNHVMTKAPSNQAATSSKESSE